MTALVDVATYCAGRGWPVFPLKPGGKQPAIPSAHPHGDRLRGRCRGDCGRLGHGVHDATREPDLIRRWWDHEPSANVGISCGPSSLLVVDLDAHGGYPPERPIPAHPHIDAGGITNGLDTFAALLEVNGAPWPNTLTVRTPSAGLHLYFSASPNVRYRNTASQLGWSIDTRAGGGYVVAPGSLTAAGRYERTSAAIDPAPLPHWLAAELGPTQTRAGPAPRRPAPPVPMPEVARGRGYVAAAVHGELTAVAEARPGGRNNQVNASAFALGQFVGAGLLDRTGTEDALLQAARHCGLDEREARASICSGLTAGEHQPRTPGGTA
jgi:hypothetical protein